MFKFEKFIFISLCLILTQVTEGFTKSDKSLKPTPLINVAAVGDIMMGTDYPFPKLPENEGRALFNESRKMLRKADIAFGNLEGTLYEGGSPGKDLKEDEIYLFRTPPNYVKNLVDAGFNVLSLANNHTGDFGREGLTATKNILRSAEIKYSSKAGEVAQFEVKGVKIGLLAVSFGPPPRSIVDPERVLAEIDLLSKKYDLLILSIHGGREGRSALQTKNEHEYFLGNPRGNLVEFAHQAIERGADLILGHGPHVPRAMEVYHKRLIAYSLGNFCTYGGMSLREERCYAPLLWAELDKNGKFIKGRIYSFIQVPPGGPKSDEQERAYGLIKKLSQQDFPQTYPPLDSQR